MNKRTIIFWSILTLFTGCSEENIDSEMSTNYDGVYASTCLNFGGGQYRSITLTVGGGEYSSEQTTFTDSACTSENAIFRLTQMGDFKLGDAMTLASGEANQLDSGIARITATPITAAVAGAFNVSSTCGFNDWVEDQSKDIAGQNCFGETPQALVGDVNYDLILLDTSVTPSRLYFGDGATGIGDAPATRPTEIDNTFFLEQQQPLRLTGQ